MKLFKKVLSVVATMALVATLIPANARAASDVLDFEDGILPEGIYMTVLDDGSPDGDPAILSVVDFNGSKMLKIDTQESLTPKVKIDAGKLLGDAFADVKGIQYDLIIEQTAVDTMAGWNGGTVGATPTGPSGWANNDEWVIDYWDSNVSPVTPLSVTLKKGFEFTDINNSFFMFMNWSNNGTDMYIDNIKFVNADGTAIALAVAAAPAEEAPAATEETTTTTVPKTGTTNYAVYFLGATVVLLAGAVVLNKRNNFAK